MEWVEVRGVTLEAAKEEALDQLGVALDDAEFEVVQEPESRWLGIKKTEARVRARVKPTQPPQRRDGGKRQRGRRGTRGPSGDSRQQGGGRSSKGDGSRSGGQGGGGGQRSKKGGNRQRSPKQTEDSSKAKAKGQVKGQNDTKRKDPAKKGNKKEAAVSEDSRRGELVAIDEQQEMVTQFLQGLVEGFGVVGSISTRLEEDIIIGSIDGPDLGLLIGPKGGTMRAIQELSRSAVQRMADGRDTSRLMIDVSGYRDHRRAALAEFAQRQADLVLESGDDLALEPMNSPDRKAVHDAIMNIDGVKSVSEGDDPYRKVVLLRDDD